jgi:putative transposase
VFFKDEDRELYIRLLRKYGEEAGVAYWVYCLMDNHVHLIGVPETLDSLRLGLGIAHWKYSLIINIQHDWKGYLWQGRYKSYPLDDFYLLRATRYIELNPVRAKMVKNAEDYAWSSARAHVLKQPDPLISKGRLDDEIKDWASFLALGTPESELRLFRKHASTGHPLGSDEFIEKLEKMTGRILKEKPRGRKPKGQTDDHPDDPI